MSEHSAPAPPDAGGTEVHDSRERSVWYAVARDCLAEVAAASAALGALDERLRQAADAAPGLRLRLALAEIAALCAAAGDPAQADRLMARQAMPEAEPGTGRIDRILAQLLAVPAQRVAPVPGFGTLPPVVAAAARFAARRARGPEPSDPIGRIAQLAGSLCLSAPVRGGVLFLPVAASGASVMEGVRPAPDWLRIWLAQVEQSCLAALELCDRVAVWRVAAHERAADWTGRTPSRLIEVLAVWPAVSAPLAELVSGASRAAVQRNLDRLADRGLIRELTGQDRYRVWTAALPPPAPGVAAYRT